jgi:hypothetical protein
MARSRIRTALVFQAMSIRLTSSLRTTSRPAIGRRVQDDLAAPDPRAKVARLVELGVTSVAEVEEYGDAGTVRGAPEGNESSLARQR